MARRHRDYRCDESVRIGYAFRRVRSHPKRAGLRMRRTEAIALLCITVIGCPLAIRLATRFIVASMTVYRSLSRWVVVNVTNPRRTLYLSVRGSRSTRLGCAERLLKSAAAMSP